VDTLDVTTVRGLINALLEAENVPLDFPATVTFANLQYTSGYLP
jgi:hypothetical protein